jgi:MtN3 and saliva related transmembrane protein
MIYVDIIGYLAGLLTTMAFLPQFFKAWRSKSTSDVSLSMLVVFIVGLALWLVYGFYIQAWPLAIANAVSLFFVGGVLSLKIRHK